MEFWTHFFYLFSNKEIEAFKKKNTNNYGTNNINSISTEYLYKNKISNGNNINNSNINNYNYNYNFGTNNDLYQNFFGKVKSDYSLNFIDDNKKILNDNNKFFDLNDNYNFSGEINYHPKLSIFGNTSLNNLPSPEPIFNLKNLASKSFSNLNKIPSLGNLNNINNISNLNLNPHNKIGFFDVYMNNSINNFNTMNSMSLNNIKNSSANLFNNSNTNLLQLNPENIVKGTLLSPPPKYPFSLGQPSIIPNANINEKNNQNYSFVDTMGDKNSIQNESEKNSTTLNMFNKKRKRDIKNNKLVFISENNKKEKKDEKKKEKSSNVSYVNNTENTETPNQTQTNNMDSNDVNSDAKKRRGSKFRGVSRNGNQWQVLIMVNKKKRYVGSYSKEEEAAKAYDKVALQNHGSKAKTNFDYTKKEVEEILAAPQLLKLY